MMSTAILSSTTTATKPKGNATSLSSSVNNLNNKRKQSAPKQKFAKMCDKCSFGTNEIAEFIEHMKLEHNMEDIYACELCYFYTESFWNYQVHMDEHSAKNQNISHSLSTTINSTSSSAERSPMKEVEDEEHENDEEDQEGNDEYKRDLEEDELNHQQPQQQREIEEEEEDEFDDEDELANDSNINNNFNDSNEDEGEEGDDSAGEMDRKLMKNAASTRNSIYSEKNKQFTRESGKPNSSPENMTLFENNPAQSIYLTSTPSTMEKAKRHYNSEVDPARYRKVIEDGVTKFACSICGNTYKWRKSLNKHWKEKHITEVPPPLDAPVTVKLRNGTTTVNCITTSDGSAVPLPNQSFNQSSLSQSPSAHSLVNKSKNILKPSDNQFNTSQNNSLNNSNLNNGNSGVFNAKMLMNNQKSKADKLGPMQADLSSQQQNLSSFASYLNAFQQYMSNAALANNLLTSSNGLPQQPAQMNNKFINELNMKNIEQQNSNKRKQSKFDESTSGFETPLDLSMKQQLNTTNNKQQYFQDENNFMNNVENKRHSRRSSISSSSSENETMMRQYVNNHRSRSHSTSSTRSSNSSYSSSNKKLDINKEDSSSSKSFNTNSTNNKLNLSHNNSMNNLSSTAYNQKLFVCSVCDEKFHVVDHINEHFLKNHYNEYQRELSSKSPPRNTNVAQQNEEWNLSDPHNPLKCIKCDFVGRWPTELQKHAASHSTSRPFKCLICSLTYKWRWDLAKHFDRTHPTFRNPYKKRDRDAARSSLIGNGSKSSKHNNSIRNDEHRARSRSISSSSNRSSQSPSPQITPNKNKPIKSSYNNQPPAKIEPQPALNVTNNLLKQQQQQQQQQQAALANASLAFPANNPAAMYAAYLANFNQQASMFNPLLVSQFQKLPQLLAGAQTADQNALLAAMMAASADPTSLLLNTSKSFNLNNQQSPISTPSPSSLNLNQTQFKSSSANNLMSSSSSSSVTTNQAKKAKLEQSNHHNNNNSSGSGNEGEKEARNFLCFWCDFRGRWRSEIIQHMRCHHAREKPYRCSACMYASNWKWDVQKHTKKQHPNNANAKIIEIPDQVLFPDIKDFNFFDNVQKQPTQNSISPATASHASTQSKHQRQQSPCSTPNIKKSSSSVNLTPPSSSSSTSSSSKAKDNTHSNSNNHNNNNNNSKQNQNASSQQSSKNHHSLCCQQCPYVACNLSDLRRHLIVHSNEQPYHCCSCEYKSKWKSDVKKHQRSLNHIGPILVGKKAMQKVIENLGLDRSSMLTLYGPNIQVIDNKQCKSNEKLIDEDKLNFNGRSSSKSASMAERFKMNKSNVNNVSNGMKRKRNECDDEHDEEDFEQLNDEEELIEEYDEDYDVEVNDEHYNHSADDDEEHLELMIDDDDEQHNNQNGEHNDDLGEHDQAELSDEHANQNEDEQSFNYEQHHNNDVDDDDEELEIDPDDY